MEQLMTFLWQRTPLLYWTQSLWRDEAYSVWIAKDGIIEAIKRTSGDFNPPFYYILLTIWMRLFGTSEIALRSLSFLAFALFLWVFYLFARKLLRTPQNAVFATLLAATNPMLVYYAFELRMYSLLTLFATLSMYSLYTKKWKWYVIATTLGLYTQPYMALVIVAQILFLVISRQFRSIIKPLFFVGVFYSPWIPTLLSQFGASGPMWIYPVDQNLILSVLGNMFTGFEGTPPSWWPYMKLFSVIFVILVVIHMSNKELRKIPNMTLLISWLFVPLIIVLGISFFKPIFVNRYVIFVTVSQVLLLSSLVVNIANEKLKTGIGFGLIGFSLVLNFMVAPYHHKVPLRDTFAELKKQVNDEDIIVAETPLVFYESMYYAPANVPVLLYNPTIEPLPRFVGSVGMPKEVWLTSLPDNLRRVFMIKESGAFEKVLPNTNTEIQL